MWSLCARFSWSNVRDKLNVGLFDAAHLLAPVAIASSLGLGHIKVPMVAPFNLAMNGNAIAVSLPLHAQLRDMADGDLADPSTSARALAEIVGCAAEPGAEPLTFGMTFPFSTHNYQLRYWMAAAGIDPDEDVRLVVLPPPYMMQSLLQWAGRRLLRRGAVELARRECERRPHLALRRRYFCSRPGETARAARKLRAKRARHGRGADPGARQSGEFRRSRRKS